MRTYPIHQAHAEFSQLVDRALNGEPQRVTRQGEEAVVIVSEADWATRLGDQPPRSPATLVDLFLKQGGSLRQGGLVGAGGLVEAGGLALDEDDVIGGKHLHASQERPIGEDFLGERA